MANRVIKDTIWKSKSLALLKPYYQDQWPRWLLMADDWGCFDADFEIIKGLVYPKRKETIKNIQEIINEFSQSGQLFLWTDPDREWGFFVNWDDHQYVGAMEYGDSGQRTKHRRKTPEPPKELIDKYLEQYGTIRNNTEQNASNPNPNPNPKHNPKHKPNPIYSLVEEAINDLNLVLTTKYSLTSVKTKEFIKARINDGHTIEDFKTVHRKMFKAWGDDEKMSRFLRPQTLYSNKFESYLNYKEAKHGRRKRNDEQNTEGKYDGIGETVD